MKTEFIPGRLYESLNSKTVVKCISDKGERGFNFTGIVVSSINYPIGEESNQWNREAFKLVKSVEEPILNVLL